MVSRRVAIPVTAAAALCLVALGVGITIALRGGAERGEDARVFQLEVTSDTGQVQSLNWRYPDDGYKIHLIGDRPGDRVKTPWSQRIDVKADQGVINLIVFNDPNDPDSPETTCRIRANGKVVDEHTSVAPACMITVQRAFPAESSRP